MHICVSKLIIIGWDNGLSPGRRQAIISTNDGILLIGPLGTNFSEILIEIHIQYRTRLSSPLMRANARPQCQCDRQCDRPEGQCAPRARPRRKICRPTGIASLAKARIPSGARIFRSKCMRASLAKARQPSECAHRWMSVRAPRANSAHDPNEFAPSSKQTSDVRAILGPTLPYST